MLERPQGSFTAIAPDGAPDISVIVPTFNEEENLDDCLASAAFAEEVLVVDSFSKDRTPAIAATHGARLLQHSEGICRRDLRVHCAFRRARNARLFELEQGALAGDCGP